MVGYEDRFASTPIYLGATAGMRYVNSLQNISPAQFFFSFRMLPPVQRQAIINAIRQYLSDPNNSPFLYDPQVALILVCFFFRSD
jgi:hypothetical protein